MKNVLVKRKKFYRLFCRIKKVGVALDNMVLKPNLSYFRLRNVKNRRAPKGCGIDCEMFQKELCQPKCLESLFCLAAAERGLPARH